MGLEAVCQIQFKGQRVPGKARLETDVLQIRGPQLELTIPFKEIEKVAAERGMLAVTFNEGTVRVEIGDAAAKWVDKIRHPPSRLAKLGVKPDWLASAVGIDDQEFLKELEDGIGHLSIGRVAKGSDAIFFGVTRAAQLSRLEQLKASLKPDGAIWIVRPKGRPEISERAVMSAGRAAGLVDVKVVSFSSTHTAEKFVIPLRARPGL
jgi:hypothetical protein